MIQRIDVTTGTAAAALNPAYTGNAPSYANAIGYNPLNGKYYFFKRNPPAPPQEFVSFDPATNLYSILASSPVGTSNIVNLGCVNNTGLGYYCFDAYGVLYYYSVSANNWTTICSNVRDQYGTTLASIIGAGSLNRIYGDVAFDGNGNLWLLISGASDFGLYKITGALPTSSVANLTATQVVSPSTASPAGTFGGMAFSPTGALFLSSNSPSNRLYRLSTVSTLTFVANLSVDGIGNDLTSCNFPLTVLPVSGITLSAKQQSFNTVMLNWNTAPSEGNTGYTVEYSLDGFSWTAIYFARKLPDDITSSYTFMQTNLKGSKHYYRIRVSGDDASITYSNIETINTVSYGKSISIWSNPVETSLNVQSPGIATASICDQAGKMLLSLALKSGINNIAVSRLHTGTYILNVKFSDGKIVNEKFFKK